jgi:hypothetical protein
MREMHWQGTTTTIETIDLAATFFVRAKQSNTLLGVVWGFSLSTQSYWY